MPQDHYQYDTSNRFQREPGLSRFMGAASGYRSRLLQAGLIALWGLVAIALVLLVLYW
jgi:hypothetical protein